MININKTLSINKILLINPSNDGLMVSTNNSIPTSLLYLGSVLKQAGFDVKINDLCIKNEISYDFKPDLVGITCLFSGKMQQVIELSKKIKDKLGCLVIIGGIHPTMFAKEILEEYDSIDFVCIGEGEDTIRHLIEYPYIPLEEIDGLAYKTNTGEVIVNPKTYYIKDLDRLPFPDYSMIKLDKYKCDISKLKNKRNSNKTAIPIISSRSCPFRCNFCSMFLVHGPKWRPRSAKNIVDEIELINKEYGREYFSFMDDNLTLSKTRTIEIANEILKRKLKIKFDTPAGVAIKTLDKEVLDKLIQAGLEGICVAPESGSDYIRNKIIGKNTSSEQIYKCFDLLRKYPQLFVRAFFIVGFPEETKETMEQTYNMVQKLADRIDSISLFYAIPFPGTKLFNSSKSQQLIHINHNTMSTFSDYINDSDTPFIKPKKLEIEELKQLRQKVYNIVDNKRNIK